MNICNRNLVLLSALTASLAFCPTGYVTAQAFTNLHNFTGNDGAAPYAELIISSNTLYGTTQDGGNSGQGAVFRINTDGTSFTNLYSFTATSGVLFTNSDGANPNAGLVLSGNTLYGTAPYGGSEGQGTVFRLNTDGTGFTNLHSFTAASGASFTNSDGVNPIAGLVLAGDTLYGAASVGGSFGVGSIFAIKTNGTGFTNLHSFTFTANDGAVPYAGLTLSGNTLYGTTVYGGSNIVGNVFKMKTDGSGYTNLYDFTGEPDGQNPQAVLVLVSNSLYGTTQFGGSEDVGVVFRVNTDGSGFTNLHTFTGGLNEAHPFAGLALSGNRLYGTTYLGGPGDNGTLFRINTDGTGFANLHFFASAANGAGPRGAVIVSGNILYGTASEGGSADLGTVFSFNPAPVTPALKILGSATNVVLTWPTDLAGYTLKFATNLVSPIFWAAATPSPVLVNGQNVVTNPITGTQRYYQLRP